MGLCCWCSELWLSCLYPWPSAAAWLSISVSPSCNINAGWAPLWLWYTPAQKYINTAMHTAMFYPISIKNKTFMKVLHILFGFYFSTSVPWSFQAFTHASLFRCGLCLDWMWRLFLFSLYAGFLLMCLRSLCSSMTQFQLWLNSLWVDARSAQWLSRFCGCTMRHNKLWVAMRASDSGHVINFVWCFIKKCVHWLLSKRLGFHLQKHAKAAKALQCELIGLNFGSVYRNS